MYRYNLGTYIDIVITVHYIGEIPLEGVMETVSQVFDCTPLNQTLQVG